MRGLEGVHQAVEPHEGTREGVEDEKSEARVPCRRSWRRRAPATVATRFGRERQRRRRATNRRGGEGRAERRELEEVSGGSGDRRHRPAAVAATRGIERGRDVERERG